NHDQIKSNSTGNINFTFELLRIRSKEFRETVSFNNLLYFILFVLFLFIIILHWRHSRDSPLAIGFELARLTVHSVCGACLKSGHRSSGGDDERIRLGSFFGKRSNSNPKDLGFNRLPQNEEE